MTDLGNWAFKNSKLVYFLVAVLVVGGLVSVYDMSKLEDPELKVKLAMVAATYPGASAHEVELEVTDPLEKAIRSMGEVEKVESWSYDDLAIIQVQLRLTTPDGDVEQAWDMLRRRVGDAAAKLPAGASVTVQDDFGLVYGMLYALTADGYSDREIIDYARLLQREIGNLPGVARVSIYGEPGECIDIEINPTRMARLGVLPSEIITTLNEQSGIYYSGYYESGEKRIKVTVADKSKVVEELQAMIVKGHERDRLRLGDIATVKKSTETPRRNELRYNGGKALGIAIAAASGTDIVKVGKEVEDCIKRIEQQRLPAGVECHRIFYQPERVTTALNTFFVNLLESVVIVIVILMLTMGFRSGIIIGISLVITVIGSFLVLGMMHGSMQRVSLAAFILAMGMLVDNAIVIVDGILVDLDNGVPRREAMTRIGKKTAMPLLGATLIAILAFFPVFLSPDSAGVYVRDLFIVLAVSLLLSWILALVHVPLMADRLLKVKTQKKSPYDSIIYRWLRGALLFSLRHRVASIALALLFVGAALWGYRFMRQGFFPDMVYDQMYMEYKLPEGTNSFKVAEDLEEIRQYLQSQPGITNVTASIGGTPARYNLVRSIATPSLSYGELIIDFESPRLLDSKIDELQNTLETRYPDAYLKFKKYNIMYKKYPIEAMFTGPDPEVLHALADSAREVMRQSGAVTLITTDWEPYVPFMSVDYNQAAARNAGVGRKDVSMSMLAANGGIPVGSFYDGAHKNTIYLKCTESDGSPIDNLENVPVISMLPNISSVDVNKLAIGARTGNIDTDGLVSELMQASNINQVSDGIDVKWHAPVVPRFNGMRSQKVMCSPVSGVETEKARTAIAAGIEAIPLPPGYTLTWEGEHGASTETMHYLFQKVPLGVILIIAILIFLFGDYRKPTVIICGIPLIAVGVVAAMLITGKTFTFCAIIGALGLVGMMIKNSIVLVDEIENQLKGNGEPHKALIAATESRLRPVMMASLTTILGMIPLLGDAMFGPMAAAIMGGLLFSTLATLFFVPVLYAMFHKIKIK